MRVGMYTALAGASAREKQLEHVSHDLSNVDTVGYRSQRLPFDEVLIHVDNGISQVKGGDLRTNLQEGIISNTDNPFDVAIAGQGFFLIGVDPSGESVGLSRDGRFQLTADGDLVTTTGHPVLNIDGQPIRVPVDSNIAIDDMGVIWDDDGFVDHIAVMDHPEASTLPSLGGSVLNAQFQELVPAHEAQVIQGALEGSNVNPMKTMTEMISLHRHYETMMQLVQSHRAIDGKAIESLGRSRG